MADGDLALHIQACGSFANALDGMNPEIAGLDTDDIDLLDIDLLPPR